MPWTKTYKVTSKTNPDKVYATEAEFWLDHDSVIDGASRINETYLADGRIESITETLSADGKSINYQKVYKDEQSFNEYTTEAANAMETEATKLIFNDA
jgi:hypothetical protein